MLRRALTRPGHKFSLAVEKLHHQEREEIDTRTRNSCKNEVELEVNIFGDREDMIGEVGSRPSSRKKRKQAITERPKKYVWEDDYENATIKSVSSIPEWARLNSHRDDKCVTDCDMRQLFHKTGDLLEQSATLLPEGTLHFKKLADANADGSRKGRLQNVEFHPAAKVMLTSGTTPRLSLFQINGQNNPKIQSVFFEDYPICTAHFSSNGNEIIVGSERKNFLFYDMIGGKVINVPKIKGLEGDSMAKFEISPDGRYLAFLGKHGSIHLISARSKEFIASVKMNGDVQSLTFSNDGSKMFTFGASGTVFVWDMKTRNCVHTFVDDGCLHGTAIAASANNQYIACGSQSGIVNIYYQDSCLQERFPKPLKSVMNLDTVCNIAKFNQSSEMLATVSNDVMKAIKLIHLPSMHVFPNFPELTDRQLQVPKCFDFSPNGGYMAIGNQKGHALLYRLSHYSSY